MRSWSLLGFHDGSSGPLRSALEVGHLVAVLVGDHDIVNADPTLLPPGRPGGGEHITRVGRLQPMDGRGGGQR